MEITARTQANMQAAHRTWRDRNRRSALSDLKDIVYCVLHFGAIKIGTTARLQARLAQLGCDWSDVLVIQRGGRELEAELHARFAHLRVDGPGMGLEHFRYCPELVGYINDKRSEMPLPPI